MASKLQLISCVRLGQLCNQRSSSINDGVFDKSSNVNLKASTTLVNRLKYTDEDLKICQNLRLHTKTICRKFHIKTPFQF